MKACVPGDGRARALAALERVAVVVVAYDSQETIETCLRSIPRGPTVIVVDNGPGTAAAELAERAGAETIVSDQNAGFGRAVNRAVRTVGTACESVLLLNPDAQLQPVALEAMLDALDEPGVGIVGAKLVRPDGTEQRSVWPYPSATRKWFEAAGLHRVLHRSEDGFVVGAAMLIRMSCWHAIGGFDELFWLYGEEADLCRRAQQAGWGVRHCPEALVDHTGGHSGRSMGEVVAEHFSRGGERFVLKHGGAPALVSYRLACVVDDLLRVPALTALAAVRRDERLYALCATRRRQLRRTVRWLTRRPWSIPAAVPPYGRQLVVLSLEAWDDVWRRNQFFVRELLAADAELRVLFVEPPEDPLHELLRSGRAPRRRLAGLRPVDDEPRIVRFRPIKWLPRVVYPRADHQLSAQVRRAIAAVGFERPVIWLNDTTYEPLLHGNLWPSVYDVTDDWLSAKMNRRETRRRVRREQRVLRHADEVVVCSEELAVRRGRRRPVHLIPNGADVDHFRRPQARPADLAAGPVAVYVGTLHEDRIDVDLLTDLAATLPWLSIDLVGPVALGAQSRARLEGTGNVRLLGPVPYRTVPSYLQHADVIIVPHACNEFTESLDPIKAHECLAVDRPTVATAVPGFREHPRAFHLADRNSFADAVRQAIEQGRRSSAVDPVGWRERAATFDAVLRSVEERHRPKVVYVGHVARPSGGEIALERLLMALRGRVDAHVILAEDGPMVQRYRATGARVEVLAMPTGARDVRKDRVGRGLPLGTILETARYTWLLTRRLRRLAPDVVHTNTLKAAVYGGVAGRLAGVPVLWHIRDRIATDYLPAPAVHGVRWLGRLLPAVIVTNSEATRRTIASRRTIQPVPSPMVYDPSSSAAPDPSSRAVQRVGMIGRLAPWKGQDVFLRAFAEAFPEGDTEAVIVGGALFGEDEYARHLQQLVMDLRVQDRVTFTGHVDDVPAELARLDMLVHASRSPEPFGQVILEGLAAGLPVVATRGGGPSEIIEDGRNGVLVEPDSAEELRDVLRRLATDGARRASMVAAGRQTLDRYGPERIAAAMLAAYELTIHRQGRRDLRFQSDRAAHA